MDGDLLAAIQKGKGLKKVPKPVESSPARVGGGGGGGGARSAAPASFAPPPATGGGMMAEMQRKMQARQAGGGNIGGPAPAPSFNKPAAPVNQFNKPVNQFNKPATGSANQFNKPVNQFNKPTAPVNQFNKPAAPVNQFNKPAAPAAQGMAKPKPVVIPVAAAPKPAANSGPVDLAKYIKLQKAGLPQGAVEHAMRKDGVDPDLLFGAGAQQAAAAPPTTAEPALVAAAPRPASQRTAAPRPASQRAAPPPPPRAATTAASPPPRNVAVAPPPPARITSMPPPPARSVNTGGVASKPPPPAAPKPAAAPVAAAKPAPPPPKVGAGFVLPPRQPQQQSPAAQPVSLPSSSKPVYTPPTTTAKAFAPPPAVKSSGSNVDLSKYVKLQKAGLPQGAVEHAMRKDGVDPDLLFGAGAAAAPTAPAKPAAPPPPARIASIQRAPPPAATIEHKQAPPPPPATAATTQDTTKNLSKSFSKMGTAITGAFSRKQSVTTPGAGVEAHSSMDMANDDPNLVPTLIAWLQNQPGIANVDNLTKESRPEAKKLLSDVNRIGSVPPAVSDVHIVAAALKEHFKSMPGACICGDYTALVSLGNSLSDDGDLAVQLSQRVRGIADLKLLFGFLSSLRGVTKENLAYTWAPHVLRPKEVSMDSLTRDSKTVNRIVLIMLQRYPQVFGDSGFAAAPAAMNGGEDSSRPLQFRLPPRTGGGAPQPPQRSNAATAPAPPPRADGRAAPPPPPPAGAGFRLPPPRNMAQ